MSAANFDPAFACDPKPHIVVAEISSVHYEARLAGKGLAGGPVGTGTDPELAIARLAEMDPRAEGLPYEVRSEPSDD